MTPHDHHDEQDDVRRLLAQARHDEPVPADVAARLDRALAELSAERADRPDDRVAPASVVELHSRRRRRAGSLLLAAAAVVIAGVAVDHIRDRAGSADDTAAADSAGSAVTSDQPLADSLMPQSLPQSAAPSAVVPGPFPMNGVDNGSSSLESTYGADVPALRSAAFVAGVRGVLTMQGIRAYSSGDERSGRTDSSGSTNTDSSSGSGATTQQKEEPARCILPVAGRSIAVTYDGVPALLVIHPQQGESRVIDLYSCATGIVLRSVTLPVS